MPGAHWANVPCKTPFLSAVCAISVGKWSLPCTTVACGAATPNVGGIRAATEGRSLPSSSSQGSSTARHTAPHLHWTTSNAILQGCFSLTTHGLGDTCVSIQRHQIPFLAPGGGVHHQPTRYRPPGLDDMGCQLDVHSCPCRRNADAGPSWLALRPLVIRILDVPWGCLRHLRSAGVERASGAVPPHDHGLRYLRFAHPMDRMAHPPIR